MDIYPTSSFALFHNEETLLLYDAPGDSLSTNYNVVVNQDITINDFQYDFSFKGVRQWKLFHFEDFQGQHQGWSHETVSNCGVDQNLFLGGHCNFAKEAVTKTFILPKHEVIKIKFNYHFIDEWTGETGFALLDGLLIWSEAHNWCSKVMPWYCKKYGINTCGNEYPDRMS